MPAPLHQPRLCRCHKPNRRMERTQHRRSATESPSPAEQAAGQGTVVLDVDSGIVVPSFLGKPLRVGGGSRAAVRIGDQCDWKRQSRASNGLPRAATCLPDRRSRCDSRIGDPPGSARVSKNRLTVADQSPSAKVTCNRLGEQNNGTPNSIQVLAEQGEGTSRAAASTRTASHPDLGARRALARVCGRGASAISRGRTKRPGKRRSGFHRLYLDWDDA